MQKHYHFIGIGGIGMSGLARILMRRGEKVTGSDLIESDLVKELRSEGATIFIGHDKKNVKSPHAIIYSTSVPEVNPEVMQGRKKGIPLLHRSDLLAQMVGECAPLLVTGTHGKTTTSALLSHTLIEAGKDPSFSIGGDMLIHQNARAGEGLYFIIEADESDGTFLNYPSFGGIITNLELDHMEFWKQESKLKEAFARFARQIGSKRHLFWCYDDHRLRSLGIEGHSYGFDEKADLVIDNFLQRYDGVTFDVSFEGKHYRNIELPLIGAHNVLNAASVFGLGLKLDIDEASLRAGLSTFQGVGRRVEKKGEHKGIEIYDDYAHHPTEVFSTLRAMKSVAGRKRIIVAFQPHRYSRTKHCMNDFADAFEFADEVILTDIYAASEKPLAGVSSEELMKRVKEGGFSSITFVDRKKLTKHLASTLKEGDILVTMGAGDITHVGGIVLENLQNESS